MRKLQTFGLCALTLAGPASLAAQEQPAPASGAASPAEAQAEPADLSGVRDLVRASKYDEAERLAAELQTRHPDDPALLTLRGELLLALGRPAEALEPLRRAATLAPERPRLNFQLGTALATTGDAEGALAAFAKELTISQDKQVVVLARLNRSLLYQQRGAKTEAAAELEAALEADPTRGPVYGDLATLYLELGRVDDAVATLSKGAEAGFASARHWFTVGARLAQDGKEEQSIDPYRRALELDPTLADAERALAAACDHLGRRPEAIEHFRRYLELAPNAPDAKSVKARISELEKIK